MTLRVAILTSGPVGNTGNVVARIAQMREVEIACIIVSDESAFKPSKMRRLKKIAKIGLLGALNGYRIRPWFAQAEGLDARDVAKEHNIPVISVTKVNHELTRKTLETYGVDLGISLCNGYIGSKVFSIPRFGFINFHGEILPDFAGAQSIIWPIYFNRMETGFTIHRVNKGIDRGEIVYQERYPIVFGPTLRETVARSLEVSRQRVPEGFATLLADWDQHWELRSPNNAVHGFTTPTIWQFWRMVRNHRRLYRAQSQATETTEQPVIA